MPVVSMSMRLRTGMVQALLAPGRCSAWFISSVSSLVETWSGVMVRSAGNSHRGAQAEYHVCLWGHWDGGFSKMVVSIIDSGAGSVEVSARPALPRTLSTSGNRRMMAS